MSTTSSDTLSTGSFEGDFEIGHLETVPWELTEAIIGKAIDRHIHEWIISTIAQDSSIFFGGNDLVFRSPRPLDHASFLKLWKPIGDLMTVSWTFNSIVYRLVCTAFGLRPSEYASLNKQVYEKVRSLSLFGAALFRGARMIPPSGWESPFLEAYGSYIITQAESLLSVPLQVQVDRLLLLRCRSIAILPPELGDYLLVDIERALTGIASQQGNSQVG